MKIFDENLEGLLLQPSPDAFSLWDVAPAHDRHYVIDSVCLVVESNTPSSSAVVTLFPTISLFGT